MPRLRLLCRRMLLRISGSSSRPGCDMKVMPQRLVSSRAVRSMAPKSQAPADPFVLHEAAAFAHVDQDRRAETPAVDRLDLPQGGKMLDRCRRQHMHWKMVLAMPGQGKSGMPFVVLRKRRLRWRSRNNPTDGRSMMGRSPNRIARPERRSLELAHRRTLPANKAPCAISCLFPVRPANRLTRSIKAYCRSPATPKGLKLASRTRSPPTELTG